MAKTPKQISKPRKSRQVLKKTSAKKALAKKTLAKKVSGKKPSVKTSPDKAVPAKHPKAVTGKAAVKTSSKKTTKPDAKNAKPKSTKRSPKSGQQKQQSSSGMSNNNTRQDNTHLAAQDFLEDVRQTSQAMIAHFLEQMNKDARDESQQGQQTGESSTQQQEQQKHEQTQNFNPFQFNPLSSSTVQSAGHAFNSFISAAMDNPQALQRAQQNYMNKTISLWGAMADKAAGKQVDPVIIPEKTDGRFKGDIWQDGMFFDFLKQSYLLTAEFVQDAVEDVEGLDPSTRAKADFYARQLIYAMSPSNFSTTNPDVLRETLDSKGQNIIAGLKNLLSDLQSNDRNYKIAMTDPKAFRFGENIATTKGKIVFQNRLMQLIQYTPLHKTIMTLPLLIVPPWINKYYILDLSAQNSLIKWLLEQGIQVYCISWVNPDESYRDVGWDDYITEGTLAAIDFMREAHDLPGINILGYCIGGTLTVSTLAYLAKGNDEDRNKIHSCNLFVSLVDFEDVGDMSVFIDEEQVTAIEKEMNTLGYLDGSDMATMFNMLRPNDLIWSFVVNNYLLGRTPRPFDLLFWNSDSTRMPARMHGYYLREMYLNNRLCQPNSLNMLGRDIDLGQITIPITMIAAESDHIAPWKSVYSGLKYFGGDTRFILAGSGHIAGIINPPRQDRQKYGYWDNPKRAKDCDSWLNDARYVTGSWWPHWLETLLQSSGEQIEASKVGAYSCKALEQAPGSYVKKRYS